VIDDAPMLLLGSPRDLTFRHTVWALGRQGRRFTVLDLDRFCAGGHVEGWLDDPATLRVMDSGDEVRLGRFRSCYARFIDLPRRLEREDPVAWGRYRFLQLAVAALDARVVNRPGAGESNDSKPLQSSLLARFGFRIPRGCATNVPGDAARFVESCPRGAIYKSNSGVRSIVQHLQPEDVGRLDAITYCPVFFQERIWGTDVRVHVVGHECHAVAIRSEAVDYRYDRSGTARDWPFTIPAELAARCVEVTAALGLEFSGIDFVQSDHDHEFYCLEVNPMPGYHGYDLTLGYAISDSLGSLLEG
jgi:glutathione synthase/RimK-type ligase-like ATP-grasp enzyme